jgi:hypothetical protein
MLTRHSPPAKLGKMLNMVDGWALAIDLYVIADRVLKLSFTVENTDSYLQIIGTKINVLHINWTFFKVLTINSFAVSINSNIEKL